MRRYLDTYLLASHEAMSTADALTWEAQQRWKAVGEQVRRKASSLLVSTCAWAQTEARPCQMGGREVWLLSMPETKKRSDSRV